MEQQEQIDPNLNAEAYRNLAAVDQAPLHDRQLEVIAVHKDGSLILGASNMVDRYWNGTIWFFDDPNVVDHDHNKYTAAMRTESGARVVSYLENHEKFVVGEDSGLLQIFEIVIEPDTRTKEIQCISYSCQHDDTLTSISTFNDNAHIVTAGLDCCIKIWDTADTIATLSFNQAHIDIVTHVEVQVGSDSVFLSTSMDCEAILWDIRKSKPALGLWKKPGLTGLTAASWKPNNEYIVAVGGTDGSISLLDIRQASQTPLYESVQFPRAVHKLLFNSSNSTQLAGCCDSTEVKVFELSNNCDLTNIFENNEHSDFVRGLAWHKSDLLTCSWDNSVLRHSIVS